MRKYGKLFNVMGWKFKFSAQGSNLAPIVGNGTKMKSTFKTRKKQKQECILPGDNFHFDGVSHLGAKIVFK